MRNRFAVAILGLALVCGSGELSAQETWAYEFTPNVWVSGADGSTAFASSQGPIALEFDNLGRTEPSFGATFRAQKGRWGLLLDGAYGRNAFGDSDWSLMFVTGGATYQLTEKASFVNVVVGARLVSSDGGLRVRDPSEPDEDSDDDAFMKLSASDGWVDLMVGLQLVRPIGNRWGFEGHVDVGAGQSNLSYQAVAGLTFQFSPRVAAKAGYRLIGADFDDDNSEVDLSFGGFYGGVGFKF